MSLCGVSSSGIADQLNDMDIPSPFEHKKQLGIGHNTSFAVNEKSKWFARAVIRIIQDDIYVGTLTQGKTTTATHKSKESFLKPQEEWDIVENAHEPIISRNIFTITNKMHMTDKRKSSNPSYVNIYAGLLFCSDCKTSLTQKSAKQHRYYVCNAKGCTGHRIKPDALYSKLVDKINEYLNGLEDKDMFIKMITDEFTALSEDPVDIFVLDKNGDIKELTRLLLVMLIDKVYLDRNKKIVVDFNSYDY